MPLTFPRLAIPLFLGAFSNACVLKGSWDGGQARDVGLALVPRD